MAGKLERIFEYRVLLAKQGDLQNPLTATEQARLERLAGQLPGGVPSADDRNPYTLLSTPLPVQYIVGGRFGNGTARNATGDGMAIVAQNLPELGQRLILHVKQPQLGTEYTFPGRVISRVVKGVTSMGVAFDGLPTQHQARGRASGVFRTDQTPSERHVRKPRTA